MPTRLNRDRVEDALRRHRAWRHGRRAAIAAVTAAALGVGGCASLKTPSAAGGKNAAMRTLSPEELRQVAATFEAQGRAQRAERLFAAADRRSGVLPAGPHAAPLDGGDEAGEAAPPSPIPTAPVQVVEASPGTVPPPKFEETVTADGLTEAAPPAEPELLTNASDDEPLAGAEIVTENAAAEDFFAEETFAGDVFAAMDVVVEDVTAAEDVAVEDAAVAGVTVAEVVPVLEIVEEAAEVPQPGPAFLTADAAHLDEIAPPTRHVAALDDEAPETIPKLTDASQTPEPIPVLHATASAGSAASFEEFIAASASVSAEPPTSMVEQSDWEPATPGVARFDDFPAPAGRATLELTLSADWVASDPDSPDAGRAFLELEPPGESVPFLSSGEAPPEPPPLTTDGSARL